jgi:hypothetical protein
MLCGSEALETPYFPTLFVPFLKNGNGTQNTSDITVTAHRGLYKIKYTLDINISDCNFISYYQLQKW